MVRPRFNRWWIVGLTQPAAILVFAAGAWLALLHFPGPFDWRLMMISTLLSPRDNPGGFAWIAFGIAFSGLLLLPLGEHLHRVLMRISRSAARSVRGLVATGGCSMGAIAAIADVPPALRLHNPLAVLIFCALLSGLVTSALLLARHPEMTGRRRRWLRLVQALFLVPIVAAFATQLWVVLSQALARAAVSGAGPGWLNVAFWEWILAGLVYGGGWLLAWLSPDR